MPFGLCNAPATFQRLMQKILCGLSSYCNVYIDDILIFSRDFDEHRLHLKEVFGRLEKYGLKLHPQKCQLALPEVDYYRKFVPGFARIASPLHQLLKKNVPFQWTGACQSAFQKLKDLLTSPPVLAYPDFSNPFILHTDASGEGLGAVLEQSNENGVCHPVAYASRTVSEHEKNYGITELEALGVVWALKHFRAYLWGHKTTVYTDHSPVKSLLRAKHTSGKLARWSQVVSEYDLDICYRPGRQNSNADALSRAPLQAGTSNDSLDTVQIATVTTDGEMTELIRNQKEDEEFGPIITSLERGNREPNFVLVEGVLYYCGVKDGSPLRLCVPLLEREKLLKNIHSGTFAGHFSSRSVYKTLTKRYWWKGMYRDTQAHCKGCLTCATYDGAGRRMKPHLLPIPVGVDIMELPLTVHGNKYVVVFVDYLTKWVEAFPTEDQTSETIANLLVNEIICRHGVPEQLLSDRGSNLLSDLMRSIYSLTGIQKINTTASHPQTDGLVENMNRTLRAMIAKYSSQYGDNWDEYLPKLLFAYRTKCHESTGESPFFLLYGRDAGLPGEEALSTKRTPYM
uniref:Integrase catalytic domain-containing protein n=1 Tax=Amphimedon queenslandica TaxID=400682 RepID=A0A1X7UNW9_AMPQE